MTTMALTTPSTSALTRLARDICRGRGADLEALDDLHIDWVGYGTACQAVMQGRPPFTMPEPHRYLRPQVTAPPAPVPAQAPPWRPSGLPVASQPLPRRHGPENGTWRRFVRSFWRGTCRVVTVLAVGGMGAVALRSLGWPGIVVAGLTLLVGIALALPTMKLVLWIDAEPDHGR